MTHDSVSRPFADPESPARCMLLAGSAGLAATSWLGAAHRVRAQPAWAEGAFLVTDPPERKPATIALLENLEKSDVGE